MLAGSTPVAYPQSSDRRASALGMKHTVIALILVCVQACSTISYCELPEHRNELKCAIIDSVVDCTKPDVVALYDQFKDLVAAAIDKHTVSGIVDWSALETEFKGYLLKDGACVAATVIAGRSAAKPIPTSAALATTSLAGFDQLRQHLWHGAKFHTINGDI